jgi:tRNA-2-methylthio-N6-dimethylallyladenosine synthase
MKTVHIETWGCQMNVHDSEKMAGILAGQGFTAAPAADQADLVLLNTCSVREKAAAKVFNRLGQLRRLKRERPGMVIGVCGCVAQVEGEAIFRRAPWVDLVMGPRTIARLAELLEAAQRDGRSISLAERGDPVEFPLGTAARARGPKAYITVMEGCNKKCAFCIVPYTRGREACRPAPEIVREAEEVVANGHCMVDRVRGLRRLRFTTSHPGHLSRSIMEAMRDLPSVCNHLHLPAQSGSNHILRLMRRGYTRDRYLAKIDFLRRAIPGMALSTDLIVGFPGETEEDFAATLDLVREVQFDHLYAFAYSRRPGTPAAEATSTVPEPEKAERLRRLLELQEEFQGARNAELVGRTFEVLMDGESRMDPGVPKGRTRCNRIVHVSALGRAAGILDVRITRAHAHSLSGVPASTATAA